MKNNRIAARIRLQKRHADFEDDNNQQIAEEVKNLFMQQGVELDEDALDNLLMTAKRKSTKKVRGWKRIASNNDIEIVGVYEHPKGGMSFSIINKTNKNNAQLVKEMESEFPGIIKSYLEDKISEPRVFHTIAREVDDEVSGWFEKNLTDKAIDVWEENGGDFSDLIMYSNLLPNEILDVNLLISKFIEVMDKVHAFSYDAFKRGYGVLDFVSENDLPDEDEYTDSFIYTP